MVKTHSAYRKKINIYIHVKSTKRQAAPVMRKLYNSAEQCLYLPVRTGLTGDHYSLTKQWVFQTARECTQAPLLQTLFK